MSDDRKTKTQLIEELNELRRRLSKLDAVEAARKQTEEALTDSQERVRALSDASFEAIFLSERGICLDQNLTAEKMFGYTLSEAAGRPGTEWIAPKDRELVKNNMLSGREEPYEVTALRKDGTTFPAEIQGRMIDYRGRRVRVTSLSDISKRKETEAALVASETRYREVFDTVQEGIGIVDENEIVRLSNPAFAMIFGETSVESFLGKSLLDYLPEEGQRQVLLETSRRMANVSSQYELDIVTREGSRKTILVSVTPRFDVEGRYRGAAGTILDITDRSRVEEALRKSERRFQDIALSSADWIWEVDERGVYTFASGRVKALLGYEPDELIGKTPFQFMPKEEAERVGEIFKSIISQKKPIIDLENWNLSKSGEKVCLLTNGAPILGEAGELLGYRGVDKDITERKRAEEEIRKFKTISDNASYGTAIADLDGKLLYINHSFAEMHGYSPEELLGKNLPVFHSEEQLDTLRRIKKSLVETDSFTSVEVWHRHRNGSEFPTLMNGVAIGDAAGTPQFLAVIAVDITEIKHLQEFAERAQRLETAGRIAGQVAHDFNNLLGPLVAYPEFIKEELGNDHPAVTYLDSMEAAAQQMADINQQLLTLGRRGHYNLEPLNLNQTLEQVLSQLQPRPSTLAVETELSPELMNIKAGVSQISRIISNLVTNAIDAMQGVGTLTITTENWYADDMEGKYGQIPRGEYVKLTIADTGRGIDEETLDHVFEPFFTTKKTDKKRGSGLGLSVVHAVVKDHDGYIDLESHVGQGTSVYLYFPVTREQTPDREADSLQGGSEPVLVVDDDDVQREVTLRLLQKLGYQATAVESGEKALDHLSRDRCDLLLLDMLMPGGIDGTETYQRALQINPDLKAVIVSGYAESARVAEAQTLGAGAFVKKPLTLKSIAVAVRSELDRNKSPEPSGLYATTRP